MRVKTFCILDKSKISQYRICEIIPTICGVNGTPVLKKQATQSRILDGLLKRDRVRSYSSVIKRPIKTRSSTEEKPKPPTSPPKYLSLRIKAKSWNVSEYGQKLLSYSAEEKQQANQFTKLMTIYTLCQLGLDHRFEVPNFAENLQNPKADLNAYNQLSMVELMHATIMRAANDAIWTMVVGIMKKQFNLSTRNAIKLQFVTLMNAYAQKLNMLNSRFTNFDGIDDPNNVTTAQDVTILANALLEIDLINHILQKDKFQCRATTAEGMQSTVYIWTGNKYLNRNIKTLIIGEDSGCFLVKQRIIVLIKSKQLLNDIKMVIQYQS